MKSQEQRIEDGKAGLEELIIKNSAIEEGPASYLDDIVKTVLEAADRERPKWPTDTSVMRLRAAYRSSCNQDMGISDVWARDCLREAMLVDPIIQAAKAVVDALNRDGFVETEEMAALQDAVNEAGE